MFIIKVEFFCFIFVDTRPQRDSYNELRGTSSSKRPGYTDMPPSGLGTRDLSPEKLAQIRAKKLEIKKVSEFFFFIVTSICVCCKSNFITSLEKFALCFVNDLR